MIMGWFAKAVVGAGLFAAGFGFCYLSSVDRHYKVVRERGEMYVLDRRTGRMAEVDDDFEEPAEIKGRPRADDCRDIIDRIEGAYHELTR
jgi:hypothetical protein